MELTHTVSDIKVLDIESLDILRQRVVIRTLACLEVCSLVMFLKFCSTCHDSIHLFLHDVHLVVGFDLTASFEEGTELAFDELSLSLRIDAEITIHYSVIGELEKEDSTLVPVTLSKWRVEPLLEFVCQIVHNDYNLTSLNCGCTRHSSIKIDSALVCSQFIINTSKEHTILVMFGKHIAHCFQRGASSNEVVEDDAVRLFGEIVHSKHRPNTLL